MKENIKERISKVDIESRLISVIGIDIVAILFSMITIGICIKEGGKYWQFIVFGVYFLFRLVRNSIELGIEYQKEQIKKRRKKK